MEFELVRDWDGVAEERRWRKLPLVAGGVEYESGT
jgi:hypothetical protein